MENCLGTIQEEISKVVQAPIKGLWDEVDALDPIAVCTCSGCSCQLTKKTIKSQQRRRINQFLVKLDSRYKKTRSSLIMMKVLPSMPEIYIGSRTGPSR